MATSLERGIGALQERFGLDDDAGRRLRALLDLVVSSPRAPTTVRDAWAVLRDHLADSLVALEVEPLRRAARVADVGSGAGFPGLPLAIALPAAQFELIESNRRKCAFIEYAVSVTELSNVAVTPVRTEAWPGPRASFDVVMARALAPLGVVAEYVAPLLKVGGTAIIWRGRRDLEAEAIAARAGAELGLELPQPLPVQPYTGAEHRHLHLMSKVRDTPVRFPRRPGVASKRPLGLV